MKGENFNSKSPKKLLRLRDLDYPFDQKFIAQEPARRRDGSRLMVYNRKDGTINHARFGNIIDWLPSGCLLVFNDSKVIPARLWGRKAKSGGVVEILLLRELEPNRWRALVSPGLPLGQRINLGKKGIYAEMAGVLEGAERVVDFLSEGDISDYLEELGKPPLPPYIKRPKGPYKSDKERYQTVFARRPGSVAAPTSALHFSQELMDRLQKAKVETAFITLHIGYATFKPLDNRALREGRLDGEYYSISKGTSRQINAAKNEGRPLVAVGTTTVRCLESATVGGGYLLPGSGMVELFILPGFRFRMVDALLTNFHLPRSSLLALVGAFAGLREIKKLYKLAQKERYRFYSYGDAMLIL